MRRFCSTSGFALALLGAACSGSDSDLLGDSLNSADGGRDATSEPDPLPDDAGSGPGDAVAPSEPDGEPPPEDAGTRAGVRVRVRDSRSAPASALVLFHDADGAPLGEPVRTDDRGEVFTELSLAMVTVAAPNPEAGDVNAAYDLVTYTEVAPGDVLTVEVPRQAASTNRSYAVTLPAQPPNGGGSVFVSGALDECIYGSGSSDMTVGVLVSCVLPETRNTLLAFYQDESGAYWFTWQRDLARPELSDTPVNVTQPWVGGDALAPLTVSIEGLPPGASINALSEVDMLADGQHFVGRPLGASNVPTDYVLVPDFAPEIEARVWYTNDLLRPELAVLARRLPIDVGTLSVPTSALLEAPRAVRVEPGAVDPLRPTLTFSGPADPTDVDALIVSASMTVFDGDTAIALTWHALVPHDATTLTLPVLSPALVGALSSTARADVRPGIASVGDDVATDFGSYRARPFRWPRSYQNNPNAPIQIDTSGCTEQKLTTLIELGR